MGFYRTFSELDLIELKRIEDLLKQNKVIKRIDFDTIFSSFECQSLFSYFFGSISLYKKILETLLAKEFKDKEDYDEEDIASPQLR